MIDKYVYQMMTETGNTDEVEGGDPTAKSSIVASFSTFYRSNPTQFNMVHHPKCTPHRPFTRCCVPEYRRLI